MSWHSFSVTVTDTDFNYKHRVIRQSFGGYWAWFTSFFDNIRSLNVNV